METGYASLDDVLITDQLGERPAKPPDFEAESKALSYLARSISESPETILQALVETALDLCGAGSAGISIEEPFHEPPVFRWRATSGALSPFLNATMPRHRSPCGTVIDRNAMQLMSLPVRHYPDIASLPIEMSEALLIPFYHGQRPIGTVWVVAHREGHHFDAEDARKLKSLAQFASAAVSVIKAREEFQGAAAAVRASDERITSILESITDAFYAVDADWKFTYLNRQAQTLLGREASELLGRSIWDEYPSLLGTAFERVYRRTLEEKVSSSVTGFYPDHQRWYEVHAYPAAAGITVYFRNVTEKVASEQLLREREERYRTLFNSIDQGFCLIEVLFDAANHPVDYRFLEVNPVWEKQTGLVHPIGKTARELVPDLEPHWFEMYGKVATTGEAVRFVHHASAMDGRWFDVYATRVGGPDSRRVALVFSDISERLHAERVIRESEARLQLATEIAQMGLFEIDLLTDQVIVNESGREIYGWPSAVTTFREVQSHFHPDDKDEVLRRVGEALQPGGTGTFDLEQRIVRTDGQLRWIRVRGRAIFDPKQPQRAIRCVGTYLDVTERKQTEEVLREADRRKDEFLAVLAHELRNPLAPLRNGLQIMRLAPDDSATVSEARDIMERQLGHMVRLIDDLLDVSRVSRGKLHLRLQAILLTDAIASAVETARPVIEKAHHQLSISLPSEPVYLNADLTRLAQVFSNLLTNSAKYTEPGGNIWLSASVGARHVSVSVRDNGIGIPTNSLRTIFDMFSQVDRSLERSTGGLGIGLALVKGLVDLHGGAIRVESAGPGQGTTFTVDLPILPRETVESSELPAVASTKTLARRRVLVVDDNQDSAQTLATMLRLLGSDVSIAHDGLQAIDEVRRFRPDMVLMDVGMPRMNGYDATRRLKAMAEGQSLVVVALTGWGQDSDREKSKAAGCDAHLVKPVSLPALQRLFADLH